MTGLGESIGQSAARVRRLLASDRVSPELFRSALLGIEPRERDRWLDLVLGTGDIFADGSELPRGCVPYFPCSVDALLRMIEEADVQSRDVFVDIGSGVGRAATLTHLLTRAASIGLEIQSHLVRASRDLSQRFNLARLNVVHGDAVRLSGFITIGSVFFFYCPFGSARLAKVIDGLQAIARTKPIRVCCVDVPLPPRSWLARPVISSRRNARTQPIGPVRGAACAEPRQIRRGDPHEQPFRQLARCAHTLALLDYEE